MSINRRSFLKRAAGGIFGATILMPTVSCQPQQEKRQTKGYRTTLQKSWVGKPSEELFAKLQENGFTGFESQAYDATIGEAEKMRTLAEKYGIVIHTVVPHWAQLGSDQTSEVDMSIKTLQHAMRVMQAYGGGTLLLVPHTLPGQRVPKPWEFDVKLDPASGDLLQVASGDNEPYKRYMTDYNEANRRIRENVKRLLPTCEETGTVLGVENVWNNFYGTPQLMRNFVASFDSPHVRSIFDVGNSVRYIGKPQEWIHELGDLIVGLHAKDFAFDTSQKNGGDYVPLMGGSVDWLAVRTALDEIGYDGFITDESNEKLGDTPITLPESSALLDKIIAGEFS